MTVRDREIWGWRSGRVNDAPGRPGRGIRLLRNGGGRFWLRTAAGLGAMDGERGQRSSAMATHVTGVAGVAGGATRDRVHAWDAPRSAARTRGLGNSCQTPKRKGKRHAPKTAPEPRGEARRPRREEEQQRGARKGRQEVPGTYTGEEAGNWRELEAEERGPAPGGQRAGAKGHERRQPEASRDEVRRPARWQAPVSQQARAGDDRGRAGRHRKSRRLPIHGSVRRSRKDLGRDTRAACTRPAHSTRSGASRGRGRRRAWLEHSSVKTARRRAHSASRAA